MSKVYMIFLFLLSMTGQLCHSKETEQKTYGNLFVFLNAKLKTVYKVSNNPDHATNILMDEIFNDSSCFDNRNNRYDYCNSVIGSNGHFVPVFYFDPSRACSLNRNIMRWQILPDQTCDTYDYVFVRDTAITITEEDLYQIQPEPINQYKADVTYLLSNFIQTTIKDE